MEAGGPAELLPRGARSPTPAPPGRRAPRRPRPDARLPALPAGPGRAALGRRRPPGPRSAVEKRPEEPGPAPRAPDMVGHLHLQGMEESLKERSREGLLDSPDSGLPPSPSPSPPFYALAPGILDVRTGAPGASSEPPGPCEARAVSTRLPRPGTRSGTGIGPAEGWGWGRPAPPRPQKPGLPPTPIKKVVTQ